jgi:long-subunit fatty acid transport protein
MWSRKLDAKSSVHLTLDYMKRAGTPYDPLTQNTFTLPDHNKFTYGVKYDYSISPNSKISLHLQRFKLRDSSPNKYRGYNVYVFYNMYW